MNYYYQHWKLVLLLYKMRKKYRGRRKFEPRNTAKSQKDSKQKKSTAGKLTLLFLFYFLSSLPKKQHKTEAGKFIFTFLRGNWQQQEKSKRKANWTLLKREDDGLSLFLSFSLFLVMDHSANCKLNSSKPKPLQLLLLLFFYGWLMDQCYSLFTQWWVTSPLTLSPLQWTEKYCPQ